MMTTRQREPDLLPMPVDPPEQPIRSRRLPWAQLLKRTCQCDVLVCDIYGGQRDVIAYLQEENKVLREQLGGKKLHFADAQRRRLAAKAKAIGRKALKKFDNIARRISSPLKLSS